MKSVIIVAGGRGERMGSDIPKQFLVVDDKPILMHTITQFYKYDAEMEIVVVLPRSQQEYWQQLCHDYAFHIPHIIADGGEQRFHSVRNGLQKISPTSTLIGVHDGVRPYVSLATITLCYDTAEEKGTAIPVIDIVETIRHIDDNDDDDNDNKTSLRQRQLILTTTTTTTTTSTSTTTKLRYDNVKSHTVPRHEYKLVQTPQVFQSSILLQAYQQDYSPAFTDDASVVEALGTTNITLVCGNQENIKITTPSDLRN